MQIDLNSIMKLMIASSLMSGKGFTLDNFMGSMTLDKLIGLQLMSNINLTPMISDKSKSDEDKKDSNITVDQVRELFGTFEDLRNSGSY